MTSMPPLVRVMICAVLMPLRLSNVSSTPLRSVSLGERMRPPSVADILELPRPDRAKRVNDERSITLSAWSATNCTLPLGMVVSWGNSTFAPSRAVISNAALTNELPRSVCNAGKEIRLPG